MSARAGRETQNVMRATKGKPPQPELLLAVFRDNYYLARDTSGEPFATDYYRAPGIAITLRGKGGLRQRLAADAMELTGKAVSSEALSTVLNMIEGIAAPARRVRTALRTARAGDGSIVLDLGRDDGMAAVISPGGWDLTTRGPALFRRSAAASELPVPVHGGQPGGVFSLINIKGRDELALYTACRLLSTIPEGTRPVELVTGQPGAAKTTTTRITVDWLGGKMTKMAKDPRDWAAIASNASILGHDNVSSMSADRQDLLCMAASGDEHLARMLYSDADLFAVKFQPLTVVVNGVEVGMLRSDLIRRAVAHYLTKPDRYLTDADVSARWQAAHPAALGWLLDLLRDVLARMGQMAAPSGDSLSDFARVLAAVDSLWGTRALELWRGGQAELYRDLAEGDPVALAIVRTVRTVWSGTTKELLELLEKDYVLPSAGPGLIWTPQRLAARLARAQAALEALGMKIEQATDPHTKRRRIGIWPSAGTGDGDGGPRWRGDVVPSYRDWPDQG